MPTHLFDFAVVTIFAREFLEGSIIIGEYRTIILRGDSLAPGIQRDDALAEIVFSALMATAFALVVIAAIAIPLAILSESFDPTTAYIIEGISKIVAAISLLQLSLKFPKFLGIYGSFKKRDEAPVEEGDDGKLTLRSIRFNVAWNIWREVAECGVFLIPFFLSGKNLMSIPLSAVIGSVVGLFCGVAIYIANKSLKSKVGLAIFCVLLLVTLSAGLFTGGCHKIEVEVGETRQIWALEDPFWSVDRLPMTILKPFGYNDSRTILEIVCYWSSLIFAAALHYRKYRLAPRILPSEDQPHVPTASTSFQVEDEFSKHRLDNVELGESTVGETVDDVTTICMTRTRCDEED